MRGIALSCGGCCRLEVGGLIDRFREQARSHKGISVGREICVHTRSTVGASLLAKRPYKPPQGLLPKQHLQPLRRIEHPIPIMPDPGHFDQPLVQPLGMAPGQVVEKEMPAQ